MLVVRPRPRTLTHLPGTGTPRNSLANGLQRLWPLGEGGGVQATDLAQNYGGTLTGGVTWAPGPFGAALDFDGTSGYVAPSGPVLNLPRVTVAAWLWLRTVPASANTGLVIGCGANGFNSSTHDKELSVTWAGGLQFYGYDNSFRTTSAASKAVPLQRWVHVAGTIDGTTITAWQDGISVGTSVCGESYTGYAVANAFLGADTTTTYLDGRIALAAIWARALTADEIQRLAVEPLALLAPLPAAYLLPITPTLGRWQSRPPYYVPTRR